MSTVRGAGTAQEALELAEGLLDRIEIRTVRRQIQHIRAHALQRRTHAGDFVRRQIIEDQDIARQQLRRELLFDVRAKQFPVERPIDGQRRHPAPQSHHADKGGRFPVTVRHLGHQSRPCESTPMRPREIRSSAGRHSHAAPRIHREIAAFPDRDPLVARPTSHVVQRHPADPVPTPATLFFERQLQLPQRAAQRAGMQRRPQFDFQFVERQVGLPGQRGVNLRHERRPFRIASPRGGVARRAVFTPFLFDPPRPRLADLEPRSDLVRAKP